ncbi:hypothetical protein [Tunicatimonas sp.]|uniref:hypothetical protein n=1 Tax=Tunicatimonas sp. TaxID=1940096 RepID=UPI003C7228DE
MFKYKYLIGFISLMLFLLIPFVLRWYSPSLEPYPALLLPSGAHIVELEDGTFSYTLYEVYGFGQDGTSKKIDIQTFLEPIPPYLIWNLARHNFGLEGDNLLADDLSESRKWFRQKLIDKGYRADRFLLAKVKYYISLDKKQLLKQETLHEKYFNLD